MQNTDSKKLMFSCFYDFVGTVKSGHFPRTVKLNRVFPTHLSVSLVVSSPVGVRVVLVCVVAPGVVLVLLIELLVLIINYFVTELLQLVKLLHCILLRLLVVGELVGRRVSGVLLLTLILLILMLPGFWLLLLVRSLVRVLLLLVVRVVLLMQLLFLLFLFFLFFRLLWLFRTLWVPLVVVLLVVMPGRRA